MNNPLVSIIIPTYNRAHLIGETLDSILAQTYKNWECIIVDDGSTDNSAEVIGDYVRKDARFQYHHRAEDRLKGANACRNYGFELSKGEYLIFLDSDDFLATNCLKSRMSVFVKFSETSIVVANTSYFINGEFKTHLFNNDCNNYSQNKYLNLFLEYKIPWTIMSVLWKRSVIKNCSFDERLLRLQDLDFAISVLSLTNINIYRLNETDTYYRKVSITTCETAFYESSKKVMQSLKILMLKVNQSKRFESNRIYFKRFILFILFKYYYPNYKSLRNEYIDLEKNLLSNYNITVKQLFFFKVKKIIYINKFNKIDRRYIWQVNHYCNKILNL